MKMSASEGQPEGPDDWVEDDDDMAMEDNHVEQVTTIMIWHTVGERLAQEEFVTMEEEDDGEGK